eukprot:TRINITY_DN5332_c1_g1_i1.p1 TRINITY_DN5332_c1_g1~~TRINITY_DN5332_c1_g1_i1.p1  ORF type:complete len:204 (+),score=61.51 TRINITY_DN5332_c1_g1_i1:46-612(+)
MEQPEAKGALLDERTTRAAEIAVREYIARTHGALVSFSGERLCEILSDDFEFMNEGSQAGAEGLVQVMHGWCGIVEQDPALTSVRVHHVVVGPRSVPLPDRAEEQQEEACNEGRGAVAVVFAHWETEYVVRAGSVFYGTTHDISGRHVRGFQVLVEALVEVREGRGVVRRVFQRSDTARVHLGVPLDA